MARQKGSANFAGTLEVLAGGPLDARSQVPTKADLTVASNFPYPYVGMQVYVLSEGKRYTLKAADVTVLANWEEEGSGSQVDTSKLYSTDDTAFTALDDADYVPVYDTSAATKKKTLWSNIKSVLKTYFDTLYQNVLTFGDGINISDNEISTDRMESSEIDDLDIDTPGQPSGMVYDFSGTELVVGTVKVGGMIKTIYQKSFVDTMPATSTNGSEVDKRISIGASVAVIIDSNVQLHNEENGVIFKLYNNAAVVNSVIPYARYFINNAVNADPNTISLKNANTSWNNKVVYITIQYIKTT